MTWAAIFMGVAGVAALFGFGVLASAEVAQILTLIFLALSAGAGLVRLLNDRS